jgi:hypothetical protein
MARMSTRIAGLGVLLVLAAGILASPATPDGQAGPPQGADDRWLLAVDHWAAGDYPAALTGLRSLLQSSSAQQYLDRAALLTGELFVTSELTPEGRSPRISADGQYVTYETGPNDAVVTRLVRVGPPAQTVADLPTTSVAFDRSGRRLAWLRLAAGADPASSEIVVRDLSSGTERVVAGGGLLKTGLAWSGDDQSVLFIGADSATADRSDVYAAREGAAPARVTTTDGHKTNLQVGANGALVYSVTGTSPFAGRGGRGGRGGGRGGARGGGAGAPGYAVLAPGRTTPRMMSGTELTLSADGGTVAWFARADGTTTVNVSTVPGTEVHPIRSGEDRMSGLALSPDGRRVAYQLMTHTDWEIYISDRNQTHHRLTHDIQHDLLPRFLTNDTLLGLMGEARHRRAQLYDLSAGTRTRLFANNTIRTISPEYIWVPSADGRHLLIQADRDGDTVSPERGVSVVDLTRTVTVADVLARIDRQLAAETGLRDRMTKAFAPVAALAREVVGRAAVNRVYEFEKTMVDFGSKHITRPGNAKAIEYLQQMYRSFGYQPELQWFTPQALQASQGRTANVIATLRGTENPELVYVVSSHFDSVAAGPGADDDTSGTAALLEAARILAPNPLPVTIVFASFTGEESGLLGSREFVRLAAEKQLHVVGALNNDMIGWGSESARMDNTIRYSNAGIRDIQHGAAFLFSNLITYDAKYYRGTDAAAFYEAWGDIVGGIGSYPVLANPNYHQSTDFLETMNFRQIMETAKVTAATLVYLASSPSRLKDVTAARTGGGIEVSWTPSPEAGIRSYVVAYGPASNPLARRVTVTTPRATLPAAPAGTHIAVKAVNARGLEAWDWARTIVQ